MPPATNEEQFKFLISCIRYSNNGKVEFGEVAKECNIVSKGAAAKRYERMMKAHGIAPNMTTGKTSASTRVPKTEGSGSKTSRPNKRAKQSHFSDEAANIDDEESLPHHRGSKSMKSEGADSAEELIVKKEPETAHFGGTGDNMIAYLPAMAVSETNRALFDAHAFGDSFDSEASVFTPSTGYNTPIENAYGLRLTSSPFNRYNEYSGDSESAAPDTPSSHTSNYNSSDSIVISD